MGLLPTSDTMTLTVVRRIEQGDGALLRDIRLRALSTNPDAFASTLEDRERLPREHWDQRADQGAHGDREFVAIAESDGVGVGMVGGHQPDAEPDLRVLYGMWVDPRVRSQGIGGRLARAVIDWAAESPARTLELWVVTTNQAAISLYRSHGFIDTGLIQPLPSNPDLLETRLALPLR